MAVVLCRMLPILNNSPSLIGLGVGFNRFHLLILVPITGYNFGENKLKTNTLFCFYLLCHKFSIGILN